MDVEELCGNVGHGEEGDDTILVVQVEVVVRDVLQGRECREMGEGGRKGR